MLVHAGFSGISHLADSTSFEVLICRGGKCIPRRDVVLLDGEVEEFCEDYTVCSVAGRSGNCGKAPHKALLSVEEVL